MADRPRLRGVDFSPAPPSGEFNILKVYVKDVSFETPHSPGIFAKEWVPDADVNLRTRVVELDQGQYEITLSITATVKIGERTAFLAEVQQAGIFGIVGLTSDELESVTSAYCPAILYPYAREMVSDLVIRGGFPPFVLSPVNFEALFEHQRAQGEDGAAETSGG